MMEKVRATVGKFLWMGMKYGRREGGEARQIARTTTSTTVARRFQLPDTRALGQYWSLDED